MSNVMATVQKVINVYGIEGADSIEMTQVLDFHVVTKKGEFKNGDLLVYCRVDSIMPDGLSTENLIELNTATSKLKNVSSNEEKVALEALIAEIKGRNTLPQYEFLRGKKFQIRAMKLGKFRDSTNLPIISQGICFNISILPAEVVPVEGLDVTDILGIKKVVEDPDEVLSENSDDSDEQVVRNPLIVFFDRKLMKYPTYRRLKLEIKGTKIKGGWQPWMPGKSDETNIQDIYRKLVEKYGDDDGWYNSEKLEGQSLGTYRIDNKRFFGLISDPKCGVNSRNVHKPTFDGSRFWKTVLEQGYVEKLNAIGKDLFIRGEHIGPGIQKNIYGLTTHRIPLYEVFAISRKGTPYVFNYKEFLDFCSYYNFEHCPITEHSFKLLPTIQEMLAFADGVSKLASVWREGVVSRRKDNCAISFKNKSPEYELRKNGSLEYPGKPLK